MWDWECAGRVSACVSPARHTIRVLRSHIYVAALAATQRVIASVYTSGGEATAAAVQYVRVELRERVCPCEQRSVLLRGVTSSHRKGRGRLPRSLCPRSPSSPSAWFEGARRPPWVLGLRTAGANYFPPARPLPRPPEASPSLIGTRYLSSPPIFPEGQSGAERPNRRGISVRNRPGSIPSSPHPRPPPVKPRAHRPRPPESSACAYSQNAPWPGRGRVEPPCLPFCHASMIPI